MSSRDKSLRHLLLFFFAIALLLSHLCEECDAKVHWSFPRAPLKAKESSVREDSAAREELVLRGGAVAGTSGSSKKVSAVENVVLIVGSVNADLTIPIATLPSPGETIVAHDVAGGARRTAAGGKGANQAVACR